MAMTGQKTVRMVLEEYAEAEAARNPGGKLFDQRRHEHQVQELQLELRKASETLTEKSHQVLQLNRDNARLTEFVSQRDKDIVDLKSGVSVIRGCSRGPTATVHANANS